MAAPLTNSLVVATSGILRAVSPFAKPMPLYEYKCESCGEQFEVIQKFSDEPLTTHQNCGGAVERLLSAPALQFKGTGWYITDYARSGSAHKEKGEGKTAEGAGKTETKAKSDSSSPSSSSSTTSSTTPSSSSKSE